MSQKEPRRTMVDTLYVTDTSPFGARVRLVCGVTGYAFEELAPPGGAGSAAMKEISPFGKMPALAVEDRVLVESMALMEYVIETSGDTSLLPGPPLRRASVRGVVLAHDHYVLGAVWPMFLQLRTGKPDPAICRAALAAAAVQYEVLTRLFGDADFAIGETLTLADLAMAPFALIFGLFYPKFGVENPLAAQPRLARWWAAVREVAAVNDVMARMEAGYARAFAK
jgi:glutathione S-transferase